ncbi:MAG: alkene reductase [Halieaceae bacterium]
MTDLFSPLALGALQLRNRVVMAPMTRSRAGDGAVPTELMVEYYSQRASAGLIITEGIAPSANGIGYCRTPGLYSPEQVAGWRKITDAVHEKGGTIVAQLMHVGRVAAAQNKPSGSETVAPSAIRARGELYTDEAGMQPLVEPRALGTEEVDQVVGEYRTATINALEAGFDGVELHATSGYLPAQFLSSGSNHRNDQYGGDVQGRTRFVLEALAAITAVAGPDRVGMRICPDNPFNDLADDNPQETFDYLLTNAEPMNLAYLHVIRMPKGRVDNIALGQRYFAERLIGNESYSFEEATQSVASGELSAVAFGRAFIANPDLVARFEQGAELAEFDLSSLYAAGAEGYTNYPPLG